MSKYGAQKVREKPGSTGVGRQEGDLQRNEKNTAKVADAWQRGSKVR